MVKKVLSLLLMVCMLAAALPCVVFADETSELDAAKKAFKNAEGNILIYNDMTSDEFLRSIAKLLPEGSNVTLAFSKETDYRIWNATSEKDGTIFANIELTCGVYKTHEMYDLKIPMLTGQAAADNADVEKLAEDAKLASGAFKNTAFNNDITEEALVERARAAIKNGSTVESNGDFTKVEAVGTKKGSVKLTLKLTLNDETMTVKVSNVIRELSKQVEESPTPTPAPAETGVKFDDVNPDAYYASAVDWAVGKNITAGTTATTFSPDATCTRAQILTFLWRANGSPKATAANPFSDVKESDYYYDAAVWAGGFGMVPGSTFAADTPCTRASTVMYIWQSAGEPEDVYFGEFDDVAEDAEYAEAVAWALDEGVTSGTSDTTFSPDAICSRGQIVTFLNRAIH